MLPDNLLAFLAVTALSSYIPGPSVIFVMTQAAWRGPRAGMMAGLGIQTANTVYFTLSGLGLAGVIVASGAAFMVIKWVGAAYLLWLGVSVIVQSFRKQQAPAIALGGKASLNGWRDGFLVGIGNPKTILYFVALLPQFIDPSRPVLAQTMALGFFACTIDFSADIAYAFVGGALSKTLSRSSIRRWFERGVGGIFVGLSAMAAFYRRAA